MNSKPFAKPAYDGDRLMWAAEISKRAGVGLPCVYKWLGNGTLPGVQLGGRRACWESDFLALTQPKTTAA